MRLVTAVTRILWIIEPNAPGVSLQNPAYAPQPNWRFNVDADKPHHLATPCARQLTLALGRIN